MAEHDEDGSHELRVPFVFVPDGEPDPVEWMNAHPGWLRIPATVRPDPSPDHTNPDAALPVGTPTPRFPTGTPASLGAIASGRGRTTRAPRTKRLPREDETTRDDSVTQDLRSRQIMEDAARPHTSRGAAATPPSMTAAEYVRRHLQLAGAATQAIASAELGLGPAAVDMGLDLVVTGVATTPEGAGIPIAGAGVQMTAAGLAAYKDGLDRPRSDKDAGVATPLPDPLPPLSLPPSGLPAQSEASVPHAQITVATPPLPKHEGPVVVAPRRSNVPPSDKADAERTTLRRQSS